MASITSPISDDSSGSFTLVRWLKSDGAFVSVDDPIAEMESEKASVDIPAWATGRLRHIAKEGDRLTLESIEDGFAQIEPI